MTWKNLELRSVSSLEVSISERLAQGVAKAFSVSGHSGVMTLHRRHTSAKQHLLALECQHGVLAMSHAEQVLGVISECPVVSSEQMFKADWFWDIYNDALSAELKSLFGYLRPINSASHSDAHAISIALRVTLNEHSLEASLEVADTVLERLLDCPGWSALSTPRYPEWHYKIPLLLGDAALSLAQLKHLREGDVVVPETPSFRPDGSGFLSLGKRKYQVAFDSLNACVEILASGEGVMHEENNDEFTQLSEAKNSADTIAEEPTGQAGQTRSGLMEGDDHVITSDFDNVLLNLSVRCGSLNLTLGQLSTLGEGAILAVDECQAGSASVYYGESLVAKGELVSIEGKLGVQISKLYMDVAR